MTTDRDPFDVLTAADPARHAPAFDPRSERGRVILARAMAAPPRTRGRRRPGPRFFAVVVGAGAIAAAAAAAYINTREPATTQSVGCHAGVPGESPAIVLPIESHEALDACWRVWTGGKFAPIPTPPRLVACVGKGGNVLVVPGGPEACARLRLPLAPANVRTDPEVVAVTDRFAELTVGQRCLPAGRARALAEQAVDDAGLDGKWSVRIRDDVRQRCATIMVDEPRREVVIVPSGREAD